MSFLQQYASFKFINHIVGLNMASGQYTFPFTLDEARQIDPGFNIDNFYKLYPEKWSYEDYMIAKVGKKYMNWFSNLILKTFGVVKLGT
jgi:hypothetical protein